MKVVSGDVVHVKGTVAPDYGHCGLPGEVAVSFSGHLLVWIAESDIVHVESVSLKVGDHVLTPWGSSETIRGTILAIYEDRAWVKFEWGPATISINTLKRA